jgi:acyl dehydratase
VRVRLDEVQEGDDLPTCEFFLAKDQVRAFARAADMPAGRFTDDDAARREGLPGMITPGNMSLGLLAQLVERWAGPGSLRRIGTTFRGLVLPDRVVRLRGTVTEKFPAERTAEVDVWLEGPEGDRLVIGTATVAFD